MELSSFLTPSCTTKMKNHRQKVYYYCSTYYNTRKCNKHYIQEKELDEVVLETLNQHIDLVCDIGAKIDDTISFSKIEYNSELKEIRINSYNLDWLNQFKKIGRIEVIDRNIVDSFIENIIVNDEKGVDIIFRYNDQYKLAERYLKSQNDVV